MQHIIAKIVEAENAAREEQKSVGRGPGGQELSIALTHLRTARLFLADSVTAPAATVLSGPAPEVVPLPAQ